VTYRVHLIAGARPNFMKIAPILRELARYREYVDCRLVHTGQHYDKEMNAVFFEELGIPEPDFNLAVGSGSHAEQTAEIMVRYERLCREETPQLVIVVGDVNSTLACAVVAKKMSIEVAHVEAGLRSFDRSMPEEINRIVTDAVSDHFYVTEENGVANLLSEGKPRDRIHFVGHVMIDNLLFQLRRLANASDPHPWIEEIKGRFPEYGVVTLHRPSNVDHKETLAGIVNALTTISDLVPLVFPVHPRTRSRLTEFGLVLPPRVIATGPLGYMTFLDLFKDATLVLTDSGGLQEETTALGIPCITIRDNTERPVTLTEGTNVLAGNTSDRIIDTALASLRGKRLLRPPPKLWDGRAAERICSHLLTLHP
jgi:UDP-N-acetylglucosamine 2-epimerase (non-hydrolysing)